MILHRFKEKLFNISIEQSGGQNKETSRLLNMYGTFPALKSKRYHEAIAQFFSGSQSKYLDGFQGVSSPQCLGYFFSRFLSHEKLFLVVSESPLGSRIHMGQVCLHHCRHCHLLAGAEPIGPLSWKWLLLLEDPKVSLMFQPLDLQQMTLYSVSVPSHLQMQLHPSVWLCWGSQVHSTRGAGRSDCSGPRNYPLSRPMPVLGSCLVASGVLHSPRPARKTQHGRILLNSLLYFRNTSMLREPRKPSEDCLYTPQHWGELCVLLGLVSLLAL